MGATGAELQRLVVVRGLALCLLGTVAGCSVALAAARAADSLFFGVTATDGGVLGAVAVALLAATALASWMPVRRIAKIDPGSALRSS